MKEARLTGSGESYPIGKILCIGRNYADHIKELGNETPERPVIFMKPASSVIGEGEEIVIPSYSSDCHHEAELALLIGRGGKDIPAEEALSHIAGYGVAIDLTLRDVQGELKKKGLPWEIAKGFDTDLAFLAAEIDGDTMTFRAISRSGAVVDSGIVIRRKETSPREFRVEGSRQEVPRR